MKLTTEQKQRLAALLSKQADQLTADEQNELKDLKTKAEAEGIKLDDDFRKQFAPTAEVTDADLEAAVTKAVNAALAGKGFDTGKLVAEIKAALPAGQESVKLTDIEAAVQKHVDAAKLDKQGLLDEIKKALSGTGLTKADLDAALAEHVKNLRPESQHQFAVFGGSMPVEHRSGNLSVAKKQLLNILLGNMTDAQLAKCDTKRPTGMNDGIRESDLKHAIACGTKALEGVREQILYGTKTGLTAGGATSGAELIPTDLASDLQMRMYLESQLASALLASEVNMPSDPYKFPLKTTRTTFYLGSESPGSNPTQGNPGTAGITLTTGKLIGTAPYSYEVDEDSIIPILGMLQEDLASGAVFSFEDAVINGDTTGTHMDSDSNGTADHRKIFKGLRKLALAGSSKLSLASGGISAANISALRKQMKRWGNKPKELLLVCGSNGYNDIINLSETLTWDKVGNPEAARILTGVAASIYGIPIIVSDACREDLNAAGVYDGCTTTKGSIFLLHKPSWLVGVRRDFTVETWSDRLTQVNYVIASFRRAFMPKETVSAAMPLVALGYNYAS